MTLPPPPLITGKAIKEYFLRLCVETRGGGWGGRGGKGTFLDDLVVFVYTMLPLVFGRGGGSRGGGGGCDGEGGVL